MGLRDRDLVPGKKERPRAALVIPVVLALVTALGLRVGFRAWLYEPVVVSETAMEPALKQGDVVYAKKHFSAADVKVNDLIWLEHPLNPGYRMIRRVVAGPGDSVELRRGMLLVNGNAILAKADQGTPPPPSEDDSSPDASAAFFDHPTFKIAENTYYVAATTSGLDSRHFGTVPIGKVLGLLH